MHIFVDACHEPGAPQPAGLGGNLINSSGHYLEYFSEMLEEQSLSSINVRSSGNPIFELECLAILCALHLWHPRVAGKHLIVYTDNNGALGSMIKGYSGSQQTSERHLRILFRFRTASASSIFKPWSLRKFFFEVLYSMSWLPWESSRLSPNCLQHSMYACAVATFHASPLQCSVRAEHQKFSCGLLLSCVEPQQAPRPQHVRRLGLALCARSPAGGSDGLRASWLLGQLLQRHL